MGMDEAFWVESFGAQFVFKCPGHNRIQLGVVQAGPMAGPQPAHNAMALNKNRQM
jgi:hypothetical protein